MFEFLNDRKKTYKEVKNDSVGGLCENIDLVTIVNVEK